ncbi:MAG: aminotransferase class I/II-fold pyridoxal phosphate-dependent enzyme [Actinobacteria bacterium]|nr:aminotransferase class I/II-fold pyridoxal phosphate-dependent enzyme [Actinomycetota bacterium]
MTDNKPMQVATTAITSGRDGSNALAPSLSTSSTWSSTGLEESNRQANALHQTGNYSRYANPTVEAFEHAVAELENTEAALAFASGMGAISCVILALCSTGDHIVAQRNCYAGTLAFLNGPCARLGIEVTFVDGRNAHEFTSAVRPGKTMLVMAETPSNPHLDLVDLAELGKIKGPFTLVDSTLATPLAQRPHDHGVSIVLHSATKGIAGHNDATLGVIAADLDLINDIWAYAVLHGATASPFDAMNGLRGIRTLDVRLARQSETALELALWLSTQKNVTGVHYPGLKSHPQHELAVKQMHYFGSVLSFEIAGGKLAAAKMLSALTLVRPAVTLGGPETLISHSASSTHNSVDLETKTRTGLTDSLLRISVGLEALVDIKNDLENALKSC